ncbi:hypothetical protein OHA25_42790 [Nonomuraea sp. NBC_00507]|uniref:hypothetical protein n=1 Tax=Nonomuraea sp. NBC_00507 TaxID=2976002 RepID=UPI002E18CA2D
MALRTRRSASQASTHSVTPTGNKDLSLMSSMMQWISDMGGGGAAMVLTRQRDGSGGDSRRPLVDGR